MADGTEHSPMDESDSSLSAPGPSSSGSANCLASTDQRLNIVMAVITEILMLLNNADNLRQRLHQIPIRWANQECSAKIKHFMVCFVRELKYGCLQNVNFIVERLLTREKGAEWFAVFAMELVQAMKESPNVQISNKRKRGQ